MSVEEISLEAILNDDVGKTIIHGIGDKFKFSEDAFYNEEFDKIRGDLDNRNVEVIDREKETGHIDHFIWNIGKSNENITDTSEEKDGFSFYMARFIHYDPYKMEVPELADQSKGEDRTAFIGQIFDPLHPTLSKKDPVLAIIQLKKEYKGRIRIIFCYRKNLSKELRLAYFERATAMSRTENRRKPVTKESAAQNGEIYDDPYGGDFPKALDRLRKIVDNWEESD